MGIVRLVLSALIVVGAVLWFAWRLSSIGGEDDAVSLVDGSVVETLEPTNSGNCVWTVAFEFEALTSTSPLIQAIRIEISSPSSCEASQPSARFRQDSYAIVVLVSSHTSSSSAPNRLTTSITGL